MTTTSGAVRRRSRASSSSAADLGHEDDARQRAQQRGDRPPAGTRHVGEQHARRAVRHGVNLNGG